MAKFVISQVLCGACIKFPFAGLSEFSMCVCGPKSINNKLRMCVDVRV